MRLRGIVHKHLLALGVFIEHADTMTKSGGNTLLPHGRKCSCNG